MRKHSSGEENRWKDRLSERQIRGWRAVSAAGLHGQGSCKRNVVLFTDTGVRDPRFMSMWLSLCCVFTILRYRCFEGQGRRLRSSTVCVCCRIAVELLCVYDSCRGFTLIATSFNKQLKTSMIVQLHMFLFMLLQVSF